MFFSAFDSHMSFILQPWQFCLMIFASWVHREQQKTIEFYQTQLKAVMDAQGKRRLPLTDDQRRLLAVIRKALRSQGINGNDDHCHAQYAPALAPTTGGKEVGL